VNKLSNFLSEIEDRVLIFDGSKGYMLQKLGLEGGECPELWNVTHRDKVREVYRLYKEAGSDVIQTNTFQGNRIQLDKYSLGERTYELNYEGVRLAKEVMAGKGYVAASIGPVGKLLEPLGDLTFDEAYEVFAEQVKAVADGGADIINFETFTDLAELRIALLAAKETCSLPIICSVAFEQNGKTLMGSDPYIAGVVLKSLGADMVGTNCSFGPEHMLEIVKRMSDTAAYLSVKPNAGLPEFVEGKAVYKESAAGFAEIAGEFVKYGARLVGGCCGTTPEFIMALKERLRSIKAPQREEGNYGSVITSGVKQADARDLRKDNIGYLSTDRDRELMAELAKGNTGIVDDLAMELSTGGFDAIYIGVDEAGDVEKLLAAVVNAAQAYIKEPFIIETKSPEALDRALRLYKGRAGVIIGNQGDRLSEELKNVVKKYGSAILTDNFG